MTDKIDPTGVITEAFRIDGITEGECRSIFLDWALKVPVGQDEQALIAALLDRHADQSADHPMIVTLKAAQQRATAPKRRGGRAGRLHQH
jgi:hypothetical protein